MANKRTNPVLRVSASRGLLSLRRFLFHFLYNLQAKQFSSLNLLGKRKKFVTPDYVRSKKYQIAYIKKQAMQKKKIIKVIDKKLLALQMLQNIKVYYGGTDPVGARVAESQGPV